MAELSTFDRKVGAFYGALVGDALGVTHEFRTPDQIPSDPFEIVGGGPFQFLPGQGSDDTDLLLCGLRAYNAPGDFDSKKMIDNMLAWLATRPPDVGATTRDSLVSYIYGVPPRADENSQGNGGLMRAAAHALMCESPTDAYDQAFRDTQLTHTSMEAGYCSASYASILWHLIHQTQSVEDLLENSLYRPYDTAVPQMGGHCVHSMRLALWGLANHRAGYEQVMSEIIRTGGDTDTNAIIAGALVGAANGALDIPERWRTKIMVPVDALRMLIDTKEEKSAEKSHG